MSLPSGAGADAEQQLRQACAELDRRLRAGERCRAEQLFAAAPLLASQEDWAVELIYTEFVAREELGQRPTPEEFYARFPPWRGRLQRQFQLHELLRDSLAAEASAAQGDAGEAKPPERLGNYQLLGEVARGGCGVVYRAWQEGLDRVVALKCLRPEFARLLRARQRFCAEARVMASLRHPHIMPVHDIGESQGFLYFSMDYAPRSLAGLLREPDRPRLVALLEAVARAVQHAHRHGVVHRDLKPSNVLLDEHGEPLVSDFGLARLPTGDDPDGPGAIVGTPAYMAPEQLAGGDAVGPAADVWALGVMLYEVVAGRRPFTGRSLADLQDAVCRTEPAPLDDALAEAICRRCLAKEPGGRYGSAEELADDLQRYGAAR